MSYARAFTVTVTVTGNTGVGTYSFPNVSGVRVRTIAVDAPASASYDWLLKDGDGYAMAGEVGAQGDETYHVNLPMSLSGSITFVNATNGSYSVRVWVEYN
jgi:hypothetical protein